MDHTKKMLEIRDGVIKFLHYLGFLDASITNVRIEKFSYMSGKNKCYAVLDLMHKNVWDDKTKFMIQQRFLKDRKLAVFFG